jgi:hypothetical protein
MSLVFSPATRIKASLGLFVAAFCVLMVLALPGAANATTTGPISSSELTFPSDEAHVAGSRASFWVECSSSEASTCNGTLTLTTNGKKHNVPFSVLAGTRQSLSVRVGANSTTKRVVAVANTAQLDGRYVRSWGLLELR